MFVHYAIILITTILASGSRHYVYETTGKACDSYLLSRLFKIAIKIHSEDDILIASKTKRNKRNTVLLLILRYCELEWNWVD